MKKNLLVLLLGVTPFLFSCQKEQIADNIQGETAAVKNTFPELDLSNTTSRENCEPFPFGILALNSGTMTTYGMNASANLGYSKSVVSTNNTNLTVNGTCYVHSMVGNLGNLLTTTSYLSPLSVMQNNPMVDWRLDEANGHAVTLTANYSALTPQFTINSLNNNRTLQSASTLTGNANTIVNIGSINLNGERLTLVGPASSDDGFIINVSGNATFDDSEIRLINIRPERVLFNFKNGSTVQVKNDSKFKGTILAPYGTVTYLNPDSFEGSIIAKTIYAITYGGGGGNCGGGSAASSFIQKTYCNGFQW